MPANQLAPLVFFASVSLLVFCSFAIACSFDYIPHYRLALMPTNQLAPLVSTTRINLAGNSFQVIMEMDGGVDDGVATLLPDGDDRTATLSWNLLIMTCLKVFCKSQSLLRLQLQEVPSHALRSLQRLEQLDLSHLARLSQVQVQAGDEGHEDDYVFGDHGDDDPGD